MKKQIFLTFAFVMFFAILQAKQDTAAIARLNKYVQTIQVFNRLVPQKKVYLHFDNTSYVPDETIWFKEYVVTAGHCQPTNQSRVLYVELLNSKGKVLETKKLKIEDGQCRGEFVLEEINVEYFPGFYEIRAYTKGMLNFGEATVFSRVFPVFKKLKPDGDYTPKDLDDDLKFIFPNYHKKVSKQEPITIDFEITGEDVYPETVFSLAVRDADLLVKVADAGNIATNLLLSSDLKGYIEDAI